MGLYLYFNGLFKSGHDSNGFGLSIKIEPCRVTFKVTLHKTGSCHDLVWLFLWPLIIAACLQVCFIKGCLNLTRNSSNGTCRFLKLLREECVILGTKVSSFVVSLVSQEGGYLHVLLRGTIYVQVTFVLSAQGSVCRLQ